MINTIFKTSNFQDMHAIAQQIKKIFFILPLMTGIFNTPLYPQELWSLEDCILYAFENNIQIKQQMLNTDQYKNNLFQLKAELLPNLNANGNVSQSYGRALDATTYDFYDQKNKYSSFSINSSVTLFNGLQQYNSIQQNKFNLLASIQETEKLKNDISLMIAAAYLQILMDMELLAVTDNQLGITNLQVTYDAKDGKCTLAGDCPTAEAMQKAVLIAGNIQGVSEVNIAGLKVPEPKEKVEYYIIVKGDTLSAIAKKYYGDANKYPRIFEANREVIKNADLIFPGQKIRIPLD